MAKSKYNYTLYKEDGTKEVIAENVERKTVQEMYPILDCQLVELIPRDYYPKEDIENENVLFWGDEEGRMIDEPVRNPHMQVLYDVEGNPWDCIGNLIREEKIA